MADPLQPPLPQPPNWGAYVAGVDTIQWYYLTEADEAATATYYFAQKITNPQETSIHLGAVVAKPSGSTPGIGQITGGQKTGDTTLGGANTVATRGTKANIPNSLPRRVHPVMLNHRFHDPAIERMAQVAFDLNALMSLTYLPSAVANNMLANITTTGLFLSIHSGSPSNTGANELVAGTAYTLVSGGRPPLTWAAASAGVVVSSNTNTFAMLVTQAGGIPYFGLWTANSGGTYLGGGPTSGLSGSIPSGASVIFTNGVTLTVAG